MPSCLSDMSSLVAFSAWPRSVIDGQRLLSAEQFRETHRPQVGLSSIPVAALSSIPGELTTQTCYALGWRVMDYRGHSLVFHGGATEGFMSMTILVPKLNLGLVVLSNLSDVSFRWAAALGVLDSLLGLPARDWNARFLQLDGEIRTWDEEKHQKVVAAHRPGTKPSHDLDAFCGRFENPGYGPLEISREKDGLHISFSRFHNALAHYQFDAYRADSVSESLDGSRIVMAWSHSTVVLTAT